MLVGFSRSGFPPDCGFSRAVWVGLGRLIHVFVDTEGDVESERAGERGWPGAIAGSFGVTAFAAAGAPAAWSPNPESPKVGSPKVGLARVGSCGARCSGVRVDVTVSLATLLGVDQAPGELVGYGRSPRRPRAAWSRPARGGA